MILTAFKLSKLLLMVFLVNIFNMKWSDWSGIIIAAITYTTVIVVCELIRKYVWKKKETTLMERVSQFIYGNEVTNILLANINVGELYFTDYEDKLAIYKRTNKGGKLIKIVNNYGELYEVKGINLEPAIPNYIILNA